MNTHEAKVIADALVALGRSIRLIAHGDNSGPAGLEMVAMALGHTTEGEMRRSVTDAIDSVATQLECIANELSRINGCLNELAANNLKSVEGAT